MLVLILCTAGCGGSSPSSVPAPAKRVAGDGYRFRVPADWQVRRRVRVIEAQSGDALVSVTTFALARPFQAALWTKAVRGLDQVAQQLASREQAKLTSSATGTIAGRRARIYELQHDGKQERIAFVLVGRREYQLFCRDAGPACDALFASFSLSA